MKIINIRGSHGSGKSWVVRQIMAQFAAQRETVLFPDGKKIEGYIFPAGPLFVAGKYIDGISTGGCDTIKDIENTKEIVIRQADTGNNVLFEGIRVHAGHTAWKELAWKHKQHEWMFIILDTTVEQSMINSRARLAAAGKGEPGLKVIDSVKDHWARAQRQRDIFARAGCRMEYLSSAAAVERVKELLL